jgi:hypothetical protein
MSKIFVRERQHVGQGAGRPRFAVVAVEGTDLKIYIPHIRKIELEKLAEAVGLRSFTCRGVKKPASRSSRKAGAAADGAPARINRLWSGRASGGRSPGLRAQRSTNPLGYRSRGCVR